MNYAAEFDKDLARLSHRHDRWRVFGDFCAMSAIALTNAFAKLEEREEEYRRIAARYEREEVRAMGKLLNWVVLALEEAPQDFLGSAFMRNELGNYYAGQYFTPYVVAQAIAKMVAGSDRESILRGKPFIRAAEPAVGSGGMVVALAEVFMEAHLAPVRYLHVTAVDIAPVCVHMATVQLSLMGIPALVYLGDSLSLETTDVFATVGHYMGMWPIRLARNNEASPLAPVAEAAADGKGQLSLW